MEYRELKSSDRKEYLKLIHQFTKYEYWKDQTEFDANLKNGKFVTMICIEGGGRIIGAGTLFVLEKLHNRSVCQIEDVFVLEEFRGRGIGSTIVNKLRHIGMSNGECYKIILNCSDANVGFYKKCGFEKIGNQCKYVEPEPDSFHLPNLPSLPLFKVFMSEDVIEPLSKVLLSGFLTQGAMVERFESDLKEYFGNPNLLTLNSATSGLTLALRLLMKPDPTENWPGFDKEHDVVLTPALTCFATTASILANDVKIRWIDADTDTCNVYINDIRYKLAANTKVVYIVHWGGYPVDLDAMKELQIEHEERYGYKFQIVEDCAHAFGATYKGEKLGSAKSTNICVFSLQAIKHLTAGDGGVITLPNKTMYDRAKLLRWFGIDREKRSGGGDFRLESDIAEYGYKFHMNDINATIGLYNLKHVEGLLDKNRANMKYLFENLSFKSNILTFMENKPDRESAAWLFSVKVKEKYAFMSFLKGAGIVTSQVHNRNDVNSCVSQFKELDNLAKLSALEKELVCIPVGWWLSTEDLAYICMTINSFIDSTAS